VHRRRGIRAVALPPPLPPAAHLRYSVCGDGEDGGRRGRAAGAESGSEGRRAAGQEESGTLSARRVGLLGLWTSFVQIGS
jgi:hypothetical protein